MGSEFAAYFRLGLGHIADLTAYDHILFIAALTAGYAFSDWRRLLWLVTAFTIGHSITLALATLNLVHVNSALVETLIPCTIVITALVGIARRREPVESPYRSGYRGKSAARGRDYFLYSIALLFGLIHGLGFSTYLRSILGAEERIGLPLFAFNVGLEVGQLFIVLVVLLIGAIVVHGLRLPRREWVVALSGAAAGIGLVMVVERLSS
jgi:hypothetical protein